MLIFDDVKYIIDLIRRIIYDKQTNIEKEYQSDLWRTFCRMRGRLALTLLGLIIAVVLQLFYNYILSLVEGLVNEMEDISISLLDIVVEFDAAQKKK